MKFNYLHYKDKKGRPFRITFAYMDNHFAWAIQAVTDRFVKETGRQLAASRFNRGIRLTRGTPTGEPLNWKTIKENFEHIRKSCRGWSPYGCAEAYNDNADRTIKFPDHLRKAILLERVKTQ